MLGKGRCTKPDRDTTAGWRGTRYEGWKRTGWPEDVTSQSLGRVGSKISASPQPLHPMHPRCLKICPLSMTWNFLTKQPRGDSVHLIYRTCDRTQGWIQPLWTRIMWHWELLCKPRGVLWFDFNHMIGNQFKVFHKTEIGLKTQYNVLLWPGLETYKKLYNTQQ